MILGIDVGGTNTDAALIENGTVRAHTKVSTDHDHLLSSVTGAITEITTDIQVSSIQEVHLSTTLTTNLIIQNKHEETGVIVAAGPGIHPAAYKIGGQYEIVEGAIDHRGNEINPVDTDEIRGVIDEATGNGVKVFAAVTKFCTRNPEHERTIAQAMEGRADFVAGGHRLSGTLNFPRRINTAYFNAAVWRVYNDFVDAMSTSLHDLNITAPVKVLKADGGTMPLEYSRSFPVQTILSGPSASVMGALALQARPHDAQSTGDAQARPHDAIVLDLGGTTTDMAIFAHGTPLLETEGTRIGGKATLVRSIKTVSIGIGGDSLIKVDGSTVDVGPERIGPACCFGGSRPTLMDAFIYRGLSEGLSQTANEERYGELSAFADEGRSEKLFTELAAAHGVEPSPLAEQVINAATRKITGTVDTILRELREKPVYTIYEMLHRDPIRPQKLVLLGGPAPAFAQPLGEALGIEAEVVPFHGIANAVGAAVTRGTMEIELFADTERNLMTIPELNISTSIPDTYSLEQARTDAVRYLTSFIEEQGFGASADAIEITEAESFAMMDWMMRRGDNIRVKAQLRPAITTRIAPTKEDKYE